MKQRIVLVVSLFILLALFVIAVFILGSRGFFEEMRVPDNAPPPKEAMPPTTRGFMIEEVASGLEVPWSIAFTSPTRMLVTERPGRLRIIENGTLSPKLLHTFPEVSSEAEEGLMGLAPHPDYVANRLIYLSLAYEDRGKLFVKVVRFRDEGARLSDERAIIDRIPAAQFHAGSRIAFGPDGKLYVTTGDATERNLAQDRDSLVGKILRLNDDGSIPRNNPFPGSPIWSLGHRNPQGIAWHPETGELYSTEHGPSVFDGPPGGDEINRIVKAGNYGWPFVSHERRREGTIPPLHVFTPAEAPASAAFYSGTALPQFRNNLFFGALRGEGLVRAVIDTKKPDLILEIEKMSDVRFGRIREVLEGPDGTLYFSTSNRDGRGNPAPSDDRIFRLRPR